MEKEKERKRERKREKEMDSFEKQKREMNLVFPYRDYSRISMTSVTTQIGVTHWSDERDGIFPLEREQRERLVVFSNVTKPIVTHI